MAYGAALWPCSGFIPGSQETMEKNYFQVRPLGPLVSRRSLSFARSRRRGDWVSNPNPESTNDCLMSMGPVCRNMAGHQDVPRKGSEAERPRPIGTGVLPPTVQHR